LRSTTVKRLVPPVTLIPISLFLAYSAWSKPVSSGEVGAAHSAVEVQQIAQIAQTATTTSGGPIMAPSGPLQATSSRYHIPAGASLPVHRHTYPRFGYVLSGAIEVTNAETGAVRQFTAGDFIAEDIGKWHSARNTGPQPVELLVVDLTKPGSGNVEVK
jgi:quercetin dioxygenase-like cupin family protein